MHTVKYINTFTAQKKILSMCAHTRTHTYVCLYTHTHTHTRLTTTQIKTENISSTPTGPQTHKGTNILTSITISVLPSIPLYYHNTNYLSNLQLMDICVISRSLTLFKVLLLRTFFYLSFP